MSQIYSDPSRESKPTALPNVETFFVRAVGDCPLCIGDVNNQPALDHHKDSHIGWYWQACFPGCLPDGDPVGPFGTEQEAIEDAQDC